MIYEIPRAFPKVTAMPPNPPPAPPPPPPSPPELPKEGGEG